MTLVDDRHPEHPVHQKIVIENGILRKLAFADFYRFGEAPQTGNPLICYVGGARSEDEYMARLKSTPEAIVAEFEKARALEGNPEADLLVIASPPVDQNRDLYLDLWYMAKSQGWPTLMTQQQMRRCLREEFVQFFVSELLPRACSRPPEAAGFLGLSFGSYLASCLAFDFENARALATMAGVGMAEAALQSSRESFTHRRFLSFANCEDMLLPETEKFKRVLALRDIELEVIKGPGGHPFSDYAENGFVAEAFRFVLSACRPSQ